jgi:hypothetical protein
MIWIAALMMAAQTAAATGASQSSPAVTAQQKQELSNYNFKAAAAALNGPNKSSRSQTEYVDSNTTSSSIPGYQPKAHSAVLSGWRDAGRKGF